LVKIPLRAIAPPGRSPNPFKDLPESPGVYIFLLGETPIYIGKAINLKRRVGSYFDINLESKTARMMGQAEYLTYILVSSELESLLLEAKLIRSYMPRFNISAKDDKHPLYIQITKEKYPRVITARKFNEKQKNIAFFGPFPSSTNVKSVLKMLRKIFPYSDHKLGRRPCLYSHLGLCNPCPNGIENLKSEDDKYLQKKKYLKNIRHVKAVLSEQFNSVKIELGREMDFLSKKEMYEDAQIVRDQIARLDYITQVRMSSEYYVENPNLYEDQRNKELMELKNILVNCKLKIENCTRIECYDIAHLAGIAPTASMVTFINGVPEKEYYRHFRIKNAKGGDDYGSLKEVIERRIKHLDDWGRPDLIIVDGGLGQVNTFSEVLKNNEIDIPVIGIAKNPNRLIIKNKKIRLEGASLNLVARMRDEAHRFARRYHHTLISKSITK